MVRLPIIYVNLWNLFDIAVEFETSFGIIIISQLNGYIGSIIVIKTVSIGLELSSDRLSETKPTWYDIMYSPVSTGLDLDAVN